MAISKEFLEAVSKDPDLRAEVDEAGFEALGELLKAKGLEEEAAKALDEAAEKVAAAHGFEPAGGEELAIDDLEGVSGGQKVIVIKNMESMSPMQQLLLKLKMENRRL